MICPNCNSDVPMQLIIGDYGVWLKKPYYKCLDCMEEIDAMTAGIPIKVEVVRIKKGKPSICDEVIEE